MVQKGGENSIWRGRFFRYAPFMLWIGVIFYLSSGNASMSNTSRFIRPLLEFLFPNTPEETLIVYHSYIRKLAHPTVYAILAFFAARAFSGSLNKILQKRWFVVSLLTVFIVASLDELNQSFIASRTGNFRDILLDTAGGLVMLTVIYFYKKRKSRSEFSESILD